LGDESRRAWPIRRRGEGPGATPPDDLPADPFPTEPPPPEPEPVRMVAPPRLTLAAFRLAALGLALVLTIGITMARLFVGGPPTVEELRAKAGVDGWSAIAIGVKDDQPGTAESKPDGTWEGFDIDIAYMIAEDLGFRRSEVRFYGMESEDRGRMQATDKAGNRVPVQMVIASFSITAEREEREEVTFSQPYLYTEQSVLTKFGHKQVSSLQDLTGKDVCTLSTATSAKAPMEAKAIVHPRNRISECIQDMERGDVEAVTTDAAILAGYKARWPKRFQHWDLGLDTTERWGVNVGQNDALKTLVDLTLYRSLKDPRDDRWEVAYEKYLQSEVPRNNKPDNRVNTPIAQAEQPDVKKPDVREQPWERVFP
jgi:glutamate transport system substrate-binding protein